MVVNKFHVVKNDPMNVHVVLEFEHSYDVRNGTEKAVSVSCYRFDCTGYSHFVNSRLVNVDKVGIDEVGN